jgi:hypothetical protein
MSTKIDLQTFLPLCREVLGYNPSKAADTAAVDLQELAHGLACLSAFKDETSPTHFRADCAHLKLFQAGFLLVADERDVLDILELAAMPFTATETLSRGAEAVLISGTLAQWRDAITLACDPKTEASRDVRYAFNAAYKIFCKNGMRDMFGDLHVSEQADRTFLLQHHR